MASSGYSKQGGASTRSGGGGTTGTISEQALNRARTQNPLMEPDRPTAAQTRAAATDSQRSLFSGALNSPGDIGLNRAQRVESLTRTALNRRRPRARVA